MKHFKGYEICEEYYSTSYCVSRTCLHCECIMPNALEFRSEGIGSFVSIEIRQTFVPFYPVIFTKNRVHLR